MYLPASRRETRQGAIQRVALSAGLLEADAYNAAIREVRAMSRQQLDFYTDGNTIGTLTTSPRSLE